MIGHIGLEKIIKEKECWLDEIYMRKRVARDI
jgi:hypothetical protein